MSIANPPIREQEPLSERESQKARLEQHGMVRAGLAYGRFIYRFRWPVLAIWIVIVAISVVVMLQTIGLLGSGGSRNTGSESQQVASILQTQFHQNTKQILIALQSASTSVSEAGYQEEIHNLQTRLKTLTDIQNITLSPAGADGKTTMLIIESYPNRDLSVDRIRSIVNQVKGPAKAYLTGGPAFENELTTTSLEDVEHADLLTMPIALLILVVIFGTFVAAALPLILVMVAIPLTFALLYPVALASPTSTYVLSVASIVGLGIAIDYSLFILRRFREELAQGLHPREAIGWTLATAGEAILFSGLIVMIGFVGLLLIGVNMTTSIGVGGALLVISTVLAALTFMPALLCILGERINALRVPYLWRLSMSTDKDKTGKQELFWRSVATRVMKRPVITILLVALILVGLGWPIFSLQVGSTSLTSLPKDSEARQGFTLLSEQYPGLKDQTIDLVVETSDHSSVLSQSNLQRLAVLTDWLHTQKHVTAVSSLLQLPASPQTPTLTQEQLVQLYSSGAYKQNPALVQFVERYTAEGMTYVAVSSNAATDSAEGNSLIDTLRDHATSASSGLHMLVGGGQAEDLDFNRLLFGHFPWTILFIMLVTFVLLTIMFRSLLLPIKAVLMNVMSISASYGVLVFIFQWGHLSGVLGFTSQGYVNDISLIILFCLLFGLSMDYEVFLLSRVREEWTRTHNNQLAVATGLEKTGSVITNAALLFILVTVAFTFTSELEIKAMGVGMTTAILVDATIIRSLLVPATMRLLGRWNWWFPGKKVPVEQVEEAREADVEVVGV